MQIWWVRTCLGAKPLATARAYVCAMTNFWFLHFNIPHFLVLAEKAPDDPQHLPDFDPNLSHLLL